MIESLARQCVVVTYGQLWTDERFSDLTSEWVSVINARLRLALSGLIFESCFVSWVRAARMYQFLVVSFNVGAVMSQILVF